MLLCFACEKPLRFCHFGANLSNLPSLFLRMNSTYSTVPTFHTVSTFMSCNLSDPSVLVAGKSRSWIEAPENTSTHQEQNSF